MTYKIPEGIIWKDMEDLIVVVDVKSGDYYSLNATASLIWRNLSDGKETGQIVESLREAFDANDCEVEKDVESCIRHWCDNGLIAVQ